MKIKTVTAYSVEELDQKLNALLQNDWELAGDMQTYIEKREHAVHGYEVRETKFAQRVKKDESE